MKGDEMHHMLAAVVMAAEEGGAHEGPAIPPIAWGIGAGALLLFLLALYAVTRLNQDR